MNEIISLRINVRFNEVDLEALTSKMQYFENVYLFENRFQSLLPIQEMFEMNIHSHLVESSSTQVGFVATMVGTILR